MALTATQKTLLKNDILANAATVLYQDVPTAINALPNNSDANFAIAAWYSLAADPSFRVWRTDIAVKEAKKAIVWTEYIAATTQAERDAWNLILSNGIVSAADANVRQGIADIFNAPLKIVTRDALIALAKRDAKRIEKLLATGTGSDASPATMGYEGSISYQDVEAARV